MLKFQEETMKVLSNYNVCRTAKLVGKISCGKGSPRYQRLFIGGGEGRQKDVY
jgi:hypothetical protein